MEKPSKPLSLPDAIRSAIRNCGMSLNALGRIAGVDSGRLSRFMRGERDLTLETTARICEALGLAVGTASAKENGEPAVQRPRSKGKAPASPAKRQSTGTKQRGN